MIALAVQHMPASAHSFITATAGLSTGMLKTSPMTLTSKSVTSVSHSELSYYRKTQCLDRSGHAKPAGSCSS